MMSLTAKRLMRWSCLVVISAFVPLLFIRALPSYAQAPNQTDQAAPSSSNLPRPELFRLEKRPVDGGAELITISAQVGRMFSSDLDPQTKPTAGTWVPLVTVLRDTLGDVNPDNDRLRYVWALTYTRPSTWQRAASAIPFFYTRIGSKQHSAKEPPSLIDLSAVDHDVWRKIFWQVLEGVLLDPYGTPVKASARTYQRNIADYRKSHVIRALSVLALYQSLKGEQVFSDTEFTEIQARLLLTDKTFGGIVDDQNLRSFYQKQTTKIKDTRGHNWELLRQQAEAGGLYFEPLEMPDGSATHALLWIARNDWAKRSKDRFDGRFLSIANPWSDKRILNWRGYTETRYFDEDNRPVSAGAPGARAVELIPLALYGLDSPKIPLLLVDFRDTLNPKRREMSRRVLQDVTKNILGLSQFGNLPYFLGRAVFDFVTGRRGIDINQPSRLREYAQLKLLMSLNNSLTPELQKEVNHRLEKVSLNPAENDLEAELRLAQGQYETLLAYTNRPDGLPARLDRDRRTEMAKLEHGRNARFVFKLANVLSFGKYTHREQPAPDMIARLDLARSLAYHTRFLREVSRSSPQIEVTWDLHQVRRSLEFIAEHGAEADAKAVRAVAEIFAHTQNDEMRRICLESLSRINNQRAKTVLTHISTNMEIDQTWRQLSTEYLQMASRVEKPGDSSEPKMHANKVQQ